MVRILFYAVLTVVMMGAAGFYPEFRYLYLLCGVLGLSATWESYRRWSEARSATQG